MKLLPESANLILIDVISNLEGFDQFAATGTLVGIQVIASDTLKLKFRRPFRINGSSLSPKGPLLRLSVGPSFS